MSKQPSNQAKRNLLRRGLAGILSLALILGLLPSSVVSAGAASWADPYVETLVDWGVMRGDIGGNMAPDRSITRAEFVAMMNRAYGYTKLGGHPFTDVLTRDWYDQDIDIGYNIGYFKGTSPTTASPNDTLTREQAAVLLARNMMLQETVGETLGFSDSRSLSDWSRGLVGAAAANGIISGYNDGTFQPFRDITRGEVAAMLVRAIGTPIQTEGEHALGNVYGNVTVNTSGVKLRDGVIVGNLYLTGGIDLGDVLLENVTVLGEIVVSGGGESNSSAASIVMRNVTADNMIVDSIGDQFVTIRAEGVTDIPTTTVRTNAYVDDSSLPGYGLSYIELDGDEGALLQLAGNVKEVWNKTPGSDLQVVQGSAEKITIDENATGSSVLVDGDARVDELNLDVATTVTGDGDIKNLNVGAAGSTVEQLPDKIEIRPGITADVNGGTMNSAQAAESSSDPKLLAGYPAVKNIAPTSATLVFKTNKTGTIYWAVSAVADGSVKEEDLLEPPVYGGNVLKSGTINATAANTEFTAAVTGLTRDGSYYVTAVLVDGRGNHSPIKVTSFSTPDDTVPAFTQGYPVMSKVTCELAQVTVMTNKSCQLYYALLPAGATAPTPAEFKAAAIPGNLGYGTQSVTKNVTTPINVNDHPLEEKTDYVLYLWLTDYDGAKSSNVVSVRFTTPDETPPIVNSIMQTNATANSATVSYEINEPGSLVWSIVTEGTHNDGAFLEGYGREDEVREEGADRGYMNIQDSADLLAAKIKVESGVGAVNHGVANRSPFDIANLLTSTTKTTSYILYYVAKDTQGNYSERIGTLRIRTLDTEPPTVRQEFTSYNGEDNTKNPLADTDIRLVFSENVQGGTGRDAKEFLDMYQRVVTAEDETAKNRYRAELGEALAAHIDMYRVPRSGPNVLLVPRDDDNPNPTDWTVDWRFAEVNMEESGELVITLPNKKDTSISALNLQSGATYYFHLKGIYDTALTPNAMGPKDLEAFTIVYAQISLSSENLSEITLPDNSKVRLDMCVNVDPISTDKVSASENWEMVMWSDTSVRMLIYRRAKNADNTYTGWQLLNAGQNPVDIAVTSDQTYSGTSLYGSVISSGQVNFPYLNPDPKPANDPADGTWCMDQNKTYQYGIRFVQVGDHAEKSPTEPAESWSQLVHMRFAIIAGGSNDLSTVAGNVNANYDRKVEGASEASDGSVKSIGMAYSPTGMTDILTVEKQFIDRSVPEFWSDFPKFTAGSSTIHMELNLNLEGTIYYVVAPAGNIGTSISSKDAGGADNGPAVPINSGNDGSGGTATLQGKSYIPEDGKDRDAHKNDIVYMGDSGFVQPTYLNIIDPRYDSSTVRSGSRRNTGSVTEIDITGLVPSTDDNESWYYIYFVLQGNGQVYSKVQCYRVKMDKVQVPSITVNRAGTTGADMIPSTDAQVVWVLVESNGLPSIITADFDKSGMTADEATKYSDVETVLDAIMTPLDGDGGRTVFDEFAEDTLKSRVLQYIIGSTSSGGISTVADKGTENNIPANTTIDKDFEAAMTAANDKNNSATSEYVLLAAARHIYGGTTGADYGFGATRGLYQPDKRTPEFTGGDVISIGNRVVTTRDGKPAPADWTNNPGDYVYSGNVTVSFDSDVYVLISNKRYAVVAQNKQTDDLTNASKRAVIPLLGGSVGGGEPDDPQISIFGPGGTEATSSFTFRFSNVTDGTEIEFFHTGSICNGNSLTTTKKLRLIFDTSLTAKDYPNGGADIARPGFRAIWG